MPRDFFQSKIRIIQAMQKAGKPLIMQHIALQSGVSPQLVKYQMGQMLQWGIAGTVPHPEDASKTYYVLQPAYYDKDWLNSLYALLTPYVKALDKMMDYDQANVKPEQALTRNLSMLLRLFEIEAEKIGDLKANEGA